MDMRFVPSHKCRKPSGAVYNALLRELLRKDAHASLIKMKYMTYNTSPTMRYLLRFKPGFMHKVKMILKEIKCT